MATREKTVIFTFPMTTALVADASVTNLTQITVYIPEASPTFTSVFVEVGFMDAITATGGTITEHRVGLRLGAAGYTTFTDTDDITNTAENLAGVIGPVDFTSHFTTNWTGTSMTCDLQVYFDHSTGTTLGMNNVTATLYVTYTYDDTAATQIKTVQIPLESLIGALPTSATNFGTSQIPQLTSGGILPENGVTIRDWCLVIEGNESNSNATTDWTMSANIDGGGTTTFMNQESALGSDRFCRWHYKPSVPDPTASHNLQLWSSTARANHVCVTLLVTYEFTLSGTTRTLNSILLPIEMGSPLGYPATTEANRAERSVKVMEPGTITLRQSAFRMNYNTGANPTSHRWKAGAQAYRNYTPACNTVAGMFSVQQRIDSGGAQGAGITLARGKNSFVLDGYSTATAVEMTNLSGVVILNYESDVGGSGIGQNNHTVLKLLRAWDALTIDQTRINSYSFAIPETDYFLVAVGNLFTVWNSIANNGLAFDVECLSGEGKGAGYYDIYTDIYQSDAEVGCTLTWARGRDVFKRFPADYNPERIDIETARDYRFFSSAAVRLGIIALATYHSFTWTAAGTITGNDAGLSTTVHLVEASTGEIHQEDVLTAGTTAFSFTVNDDTEDYYVSAYQDDTHVGRSGLATAA